MTSAVVAWAGFNPLPCTGAILKPARQRLGLTRARLCGRISHRHSEFVDCPQFANDLNQHRQAEQNR